MKKMIVAIILIFSSSLSFALEKHPLVHNHHAFVEKGDIYDNGYPQTKYNEVLNTFKRVYGLIIKKEGGTFHIMDDWSDGAVNMWAWRQGSEYWLEIPGGMSRYHLINEEAFIVTICHELGHLLGGEPTRGNGSISLEGQADYYSTSSCVKQMLKEIKPYKGVTIDQEVLDRCSGEAQLDTCQRALMGSLSITSYYAFLEKVGFPKLSTPSQRRVAQTLRIHPKAQCRLDTLYAGFVGGIRPRCWFKPRDK
jgi:hypothetical protein